jgi:hypothetical protein
VKKRGAPPTERKARTGELTPPGMVFWARVKELFVAGHGRLVFQFRKWRRHRRKYRAASLGGGKKLLVGIGAGLDVHGIEQVADHGEDVGAGIDCNCGALSSVMPPMAATGKPKRRAWLRPAVPAARARLPGLVRDGNMLPKAM